MGRVTRSSIQKPTRRNLNGSGYRLTAETLRKTLRTFSKIVFSKPISSYITPILKSRNSMAQKCAIGLITAVAASVSLSQSKVAAADGPFTFPPANPQQQAASSPPSTAGEESSAPPPPPRARNDNPRTSSGGFDPEALERGAKALKEINNSSYAKNVFFFFFLKQLNYYYQIRSLCRISALVSFRLSPLLLLLSCVCFFFLISGV